MAEQDSWRDKSMAEILAEWDVILYHTDSYRQKPILSRRQAMEAEAEERNFQMYRSMMIGEYQRPQKIHWWYKASKEWG